MQKKKKDEAIQVASNKLALFIKKTILFHFPFIYGFGMKILKVDFGAGS